MWLDAFEADSSKESPKPPQNDQTHILHLSRFGVKTLSESKSGMSKNDKRTLYVGGLQDDVVCEHIRAAFIPFGEVTAPPILLRSRERNGEALRRAPPPPPSSRGLGEVCIQPCGDTCCADVVGCVAIRRKYQSEKAPSLSFTHTHCHQATSRGAQRGAKGGALTIIHGQVVDVNIPLDNSTGLHRGFGFVEYENAADASEAIFNMNNGELFGRVLTVRPPPTRPNRCSLRCTKLQGTNSMIGVHESCMPLRPREGSGTLVEPMEEPFQIVPVPLQGGTGVPRP
jgi:RNA recognition motif-containing protein